MDQNKSVTYIQVPLNQNNNNENIDKEKQDGITAIKHTIARSEKLYNENKELRIEVNNLEHKLEGEESINDSNDKKINELRNLLKNINEERLLLQEINEKHLKSIEIHKNNYDNEHKIYRLFENLFIGTLFIHFVLIHLDIILWGGSYYQVIINILLSFGISKINFKINASSKLKSYRNNIDRNGLLLENKKKDIKHCIHKIKELKLTNDLLTNYIDSI